jgi:PadR family transcriptional regulator, regulatory protein PadR
MAREPKSIEAKLAETRLSHTAAMILQALDAGFVYGFSIMEMTGLPSGTVYPAMRRLERDELIRSQWEKQSIADAEQRPPRKYYKLTAAGKSTLEASRRRYPLLTRLIPAPLIPTEEASSV